MSPRTLADFYSELRTLCHWDCHTRGEVTNGFAPACIYCEARANLVDVLNQIDAALNHRIGNELAPESIASLRRLVDKHWGALIETLTLDNPGGSSPQEGADT